MRVLFALILLFCFQSVVAQRNEQQAKELADSLNKVIKKNPSKFCALIEQFSDDPASKETCGLYGFEKGEAFVPPIAQVVRASKKSTKIQAPVRTYYGYHIIQPMGTRGDEIQFKHLLIARIE
jgi:parvulin-like peptidyl-prolyl isomerase